MELIIKILLLLLKIFEILTHPIYWYYAIGKKKVINPPNDPLLTVSATKLSARIRKKEITSEEVVRVFINRIKEVNPIINAVVDQRYNDAIKEARNVDQYLLKSSMSEAEIEKLKPLLGVPLTVKESCSLQGMALSVGLLSRTGYTAERDGTIVARLRTSGAIPLLVSNTPELCIGIESYNFLIGRTSNPYDSTRTAGGSSGGEGALIGAAASLIGIGSDLAGSVRIPAHYNGIFGHKPSPRIANVKGHYPIAEDNCFQDYFVIGPLARYAEDLKLMMNVIVDPHMKITLKLNVKINFKNLNIFFMDESGSLVLPSVEKEIKQTIHIAVKYLKENCGCIVQEHKFRELEDVFPVCTQTMSNLEGQPNPFQKDKNIFSLIKELFKSMVNNSKYTPALMLILIQQKIQKFLVSDYKPLRDAWRQNFINILKDDGIFIFPTTPTAAPLHNKFYFNTQIMALPGIANSLGFPATHIPCGLNKKGLPIGFQIMAAPNQDRLCLAVAEELEKCFGGWVPP